MKLVTYRSSDSSAERVGILKGSAVIPVKAQDMNDVILNMSIEELKTLAEHTEGIPLSEVKLLSPVPRPLQDIICIGLNYTEHAEEALDYSHEAFSFNKEEPIFFSKRVNYSQGSGEPIPSHSDITEKLDFENELAVILGKDAEDVSAEDAADYIFGYTIINDVSARDLQTRHKQWYFGKGLDGFSPMGPCIVTADEFSFPPRLGISTVINGETRQQSNTGMLIHGIGELISTLSKGMTLKAGTIIATGTPKGVCMGMKNPVFLKHGDVVSCRIEGIGELVNTVD